MQSDPGVLTEEEKQQVRKMLKDYQDILVRLVEIVDLTATAQLKTKENDNDELRYYQGYANGAAAVLLTALQQKNKIKA